MSYQIESKLKTAQENFRAGYLDAAQRLLVEVVQAEPVNGQAWEGLGYIAAKQNNYTDAADHLDHAVRLLPTDLSIIFFAGHVNQCAGRYMQAAEYFKRYLLAHPSHLPSIQGLATSLAAAENYEAALSTLTKAEKYGASLAEIHYNKGKIFAEMGRHDSEILAYQQALKLRPDLVDAWVNLGVAHRDMAQFDQALRCFKKAVLLDPEHAGARTNRAQTNLLLGDFQHGWREYEWRWRDGGQQRDFEEGKLWLGKTDIDGKTILVWHEQGLGDTIQFVRYIEKLAELGPRVILRVQSVLLPLLRDCLNCQVIGENDGVPDFDWHVPLMSLPQVLDAHADIPVKIPYLWADAKGEQQWGDILGSGKKKLRVGIVWCGSRTHLNDRNRSTDLDVWDRVLDLDAEFFSLQKDVREKDIAVLAQRPTLINAADRIVSFADTASLVAQLDVVISVDTSVVHLAGAMGKAVWVALPFMPDWRWQLSRTDSPWYPTARLFRQKTLGDWSCIVDEMRQALLELIQGESFESL